MQDIQTISKFPPLSNSMDYEFLRLEGMRYIEQLASAVWTDYNSHDPGITTLEALCYTITDLGHRTNFPIEDLLADANGSLNGQFFTAKEILTNNPLTINDYRKLLIDIEGIKNAWLQVASGGEVPVYVNCLESKLQLAPETDHSIKINGLYEVIIDCDVPDGDFDALKTAALDVLHAHRNLSEDFLCPIKIEAEEIGICADIEVTNEADIEKVEAEICFRIARFLNPPVAFYSLAQMYEKGKISEEIFDGPVLQHGFIDNDDLEKAKLRTEIHISDIYRLLMEIEGVMAIKKLKLVNYANEPDGNGDTVKKPLTKGEAWVLKLSPGKKPALNKDCSSITFFKDEVIPYRANSGRVKLHLDLLEDLGEQSLVIDDIRDIPLPEGAHFDFEKYTSIQELYPDTYGIGETGLSISADPLRKAQTKQLKGYLLFFDQLMANYFSQLKHAKELLSVEQNYPATYFAQPLFDIPGIRPLYLNFTGTTDAEWESFKQNPLTLKRLFHWLETGRGRQQRTNRILDHLLGRFAESFNDYVLLTYQMANAQNGQADARTTAEIIRDKKAFLKDYPAISRNRGKAINYRLPYFGHLSYYDRLLYGNGPENISGLKRRVSRLMGINEVEEGSLVCQDLSIFILPNDSANYTFVLMDDNFRNLFYSYIYGSLTDALADASLVLELMKNEANYKIGNGQDWIRLCDEEGNFLGESDHFGSEEEVLAFKEGLIYMANHIVCPIKRIVIFPDDTGKFKFRLEDENGDGLMTGIKEYVTSTNAYNKAIAFSQYLKNSSKYRIDNNTLEILNDNENPVAQSSTMQNGKEAEQLKQQIFNMVCCEKCSKEGFYIVEHLLLRPQSQHHQNLFCIDTACPPCECSDGLTDPYTFRISLIVPYWPERFQNMVFRHYFEKVIRLETPAHIALKICWINCEQMSEFENRYNNWRIKKAGHDPCSEDNQADIDLAQCTDDLTALLCQLKNIYPDTPTFHDCENEDSGGGIVLNNVHLD